MVSKVRWLFANSRPYTTARGYWKIAIFDRFLWETIQDMAVEYNYSSDRFVYSQCRKLGHVTRWWSPTPSDRGEQRPLSPLHESSCCPEQRGRMTHAARMSHPTAGAPRPHSDRQTTLSGLRPPTMVTRAPIPFPPPSILCGREGRGGRMEGGREEKHDSYCVSYAVETKAFLSLSEGGDESPPTRSRVLVFYTVVGWTCQAVIIRYFWPQLQWKTNRNSYAIYGIVPFLMTFSSP